MASLRISIIAAVAIVALSFAAICRARPAALPQLDHHDGKWLRSQLKHHHHLNSLNHNNNNNNNNNNNENNIKDDLLYNSLIGDRSAAAALAAEYEREREQAIIDEEALQQQRKAEEYLQFLQQLNSNNNDYDATLNPSQQQQQQQQQEEATMLKLEDQYDLQPASGIYGDNGIFADGPVSEPKVYPILFGDDGTDVTDSADEQAITNEELDKLLLNYLLLSRLQNGNNDNDDNDDNEQEDIGENAKANFGIDDTNDAIEKRRHKIVMSGEKKRSSKSKLDDATMQKKKKKMEETTKATNEKSNNKFKINVRRGQKEVAVLRPMETTKSPMMNKVAAAAEEDDKEWPAELDENNLDNEQQQQQPSSKQVRGQSRPVRDVLTSQLDSLKTEAAETAAAAASNRASQPLTNQ